MRQRCTVRTQLGRIGSGHAGPSRSGVVHMAQSERPAAGCAPLWRAARSLRALLHGATTSVLGGPLPVLLAGAASRTSLDDGEGDIQGRSHGGPANPPACVGRPARRSPSQRPPAARSVPGHDFAFGVLVDTCDGACRSALRRRPYAAIRCAAPSPQPALALLRGDEGLRIGLIVDQAYVGESVQTRSRRRRPGSPAIAAPAASPARGRAAPSAAEGRSPWPRFRGRRVGSSG